MKTINILETDNWFQGEDKQFTVEMVDAAEASLNVTSYAMDFTVEELHDADADLILKATSGSGIIVSDGSLVTIDIDSVDTLELEPRVYHLALWRTDSGVRQLLAEGSAMLQKAAVRGGGS